MSLQIVLCTYIAAYSFFFCCILFTGAWGWNQRDGYYMWCLGLRNFVLAPISGFNRDMLRNRGKTEAVCVKPFRWLLLVLFTLLFLVRSSGCYTKALQQ